MALENKTYNLSISSTWLVCCCMTVFTATWHDDHIVYIQLYILAALQYGNVVHCVHGEGIMIITPVKGGKYHLWISGWLSKNVLLKFETSQLNSWKARFQRSLIGQFESTNPDHQKLVILIGWLCCQTANLKFTVPQLYCIASTQNNLGLHILWVGYNTIQLLCVISTESKAFSGCVHVWSQSPFHTNISLIHSPQSDFIHWGEQGQQ